MADQIRIVIRAFGRGMASFGSGFDWSDRRRVASERGLARHFASVGSRLSRAAKSYQENHPELQHA